jgi:hypothetical protein
LGLYIKRQTRPRWPQPSQCTKPLEGRVNPCQQGGLAALRRGHWHEVAAGERSIPARRKERAELPSAITWWSRLDRARRPLSGATRSWESRCVRPLFCTRRRTTRAGAAGNDQADGRRRISARGVELARLIGRTQAGRSRLITASVGKHRGLSGHASPQASAAC